jgi:hypothetical protein
LKMFRGNIFKVPIDKNWFPYNGTASPW